MRYIVATNYLSQTFAIKSLDIDSTTNALLTVTPINYTDIPQNCISYIGHSDAAYFISLLLGEQYKANRDELKFKSGDTLYVVMAKGNDFPRQGIDDVGENDEEIKKKILQKYMCLKVESQGFSGVIAMNNNRLLKTGMDYLTYNFPLRALKLVNYTAYIQVTKIDANDIPSNAKVVLKYSNQAIALRKLLPQLNKIYANPKEINLKSGDVVYVATLDSGRVQNHNHHYSVGYYLHHSMFLKAEIWGFTQE